MGKRNAKVWKGRKTKEKLGERGIDKEEKGKNIHTYIKKYIRHTTYLLKEMDRHHVEKYSLHDGSERRLKTITTREKGDSTASI